MRIGFHTDAFNSSVWNFEKCLDWAQKNDVTGIECGVLDGVSWIHGLGYFPHLALYQDPLTTRLEAQKRGVQITQIDAAYPLSGPDGPVYGVPYVLKSIPWAKLVGAKNIATTDGLYKPAGLTDNEALAQMKRSYLQILEVAQRYGIHINIEVHGYFTTNPDFLEEMLNFSDSEYLGLNFDTGNSFISGNDPVAFCKRFLKYIRHVHIKDVSPSLAAAARGEDKGIGISHCPIGSGVNAQNIEDCLVLLRDFGYHGVLSMETEGGGGPLIEQSLHWLRHTLERLHIPEEK